MKINKSWKFNQIAVGTILSPHGYSEQVCVKRLLHHRELETKGDVKTHVRRIEASLCIK